VNTRSSFLAGDHARLRRCVWLILASLLTACGGGGGGPPLPVTVVVTSLPLRDGYVSYLGTAETGSAPIVGDIEAIVPGDHVRAVVGFDLGGSGVPSTATIQSAVLSMRQIGTWSNPFTDLGHMLLDHVELGSSIDLTDFDAHTLHSGFGVFATAIVPAMNSLEVGVLVQADLAAGRTFSDFRLRFPTDLDRDDVNDYTAFVDSEDVTGTGAAPTLTITYRP
jgi:hypothetical protein